MAFPLTLGTLSFLAAVFWGGPLIRLLKKYRMGKQIRVEEPTSHQVKMGTPTMGGLMILIPVFIITAGLNLINVLGLTLIGRSVIVPMAVLVAFGVLGAIDDYMGVRGMGKAGGMSGRTKIAWQILFALVVALVLYFGLELRSIAIPTIPDKIDIGLWYIPIAVFFIVGGSNAVNLSDGMDGLAGSLSAIAFAAYGIIAYLQGQSFLVAFCFTMVGALLAFLWYNAHPAELFMGDAGALSIGATLGTVALMTGQWLLLPIIALVFIAEALSVIIQVGYFKWTHGKRFFKMAPLHLHFELKGWSETQTVQRFWLCGILCAMLGVALALA
ncbi:MAG: phospho-N-acetylmuramoyl-pentapeptide-transferase [Chloroflexi bacterium]|nr:phospho-N-acetylmuramoyl-pentapeptide-transferase [Chloroflexota bacterium]